jgi:hypothetical protein
VKEGNAPAARAILRIAGQTLLGRIRGSLSRSASCLSGPPGRRDSGALEEQMNYIPTRFPCKFDAAKDTPLSANGYVAEPWHRADQFPIVAAAPL